MAIIIKREKYLEFDNIYTTNEPSTHESKKGNSFYPAFEAVSQTANITAIVSD